MPDSASATAGQTVLINVLVNDVFASGPWLTAALRVGSPQWGTAVVVVGAGSYVNYTAPSGFVGVDTFTYTMTDGVGAESTATVSVTGTGTRASSPRAVDDWATTDSGRSITIAVLANDLLGAAAGPLTVTAGSARHGTTTVYPLASPASIVYWPDSRFVGVDSFPYTIRDSAGRTSTATVTVYVGASPSFSVDGSDARDGYGTTIATATKVVDSDGSNVLRITNTGGASFYRAWSPVTTLGTARTVTFSAWVRGEGDAIGREVRLYGNIFGGASGAQLGYASTRLTSGWQLVTYTITAGSDQTSAQVWVQRDGDHPAAGESFLLGVTAVR